MTTEEFISYARTRGWHTVDAAVFGAHRGYPFHGVFTPAGRGSVTLTLTVAGKLTGKTLKAIRTALPKGCANRAVTQAGTVSVVCADRSGDLTSVLEEVLDLIVNFLQADGLVPSEICPICKRPGCDAVALMGSYVPVHRACVEEMARNTEAEAEKNDIMGNYLTGALGALVGGLVGVIPNVLAAVLLERIFAVLYALIPLAAYYGYKLCKGRMNKGALVCALISSVLNLFVVEYVTQFIWLCMSFELTFGESMSFLADGIGVYTQAFFEVLAEGGLAENLIQGAVFLLLGILFSWRQISRTSSHDVQGAAAVCATLRAWPGCGPLPETSPVSSSPITADRYSGPELDEH